MAVTAILCGVASSQAQTNPTAQSLPFSMASQTGSALPAGLAVHKFTAIPTTRTTAPANGDLSYSTTANAGSWHDEGANGIGVLASGTQPAGAVVVAINTTGKTGINVSWICHTILAQASRDNSVALQYRVGTSGNFTDVGTTSTYTSAGKTPIDVSPTFTETLPAAADNQPVVQVRWIYWESAGTTGSRDRIAVDDINITGGSIGQTNPVAVATVSPSTASPGESVLLTVTVTPGTNPTSSGVSVTGNLTSIGGSASQIFTAGANNTFTYTANLPSNLAYGAKSLSFSVTDVQSRTATATANLTVAGNVTIFHTNDTHARVTPHKWVVPQHGTGTTQVFEDVGGVAYMGGKILELTTATPDALVLDGGDISEGNPIGDWNGPGFVSGTYGDGTIVDYYKMLHAKLKAIPGRGGRGLDAMVVGNHDIRDITYFNNMTAASVKGDPVNGFHLLSMNICIKGTHTAYYEPYTIVNVNGNKIGIIGYTTESADSPEPEVNNLVDVVKCDWSSTDTTKIHFADIVNELRNNQGCNLVFLLTHMGHSGLCTITGANPTPILVDTAAAKLPEVVVSGHWHTYAETVWQPTSLNYKTIFTEAGSFQHYVGELRVNGIGKYLGATYYPLMNSIVTPDADIANYVAQRKIDYAAAPSSITPTPPGVDDVVGYTNDNLLLDNYMKWWSADEYPWSGNNTAGNWICDAVQWKAAQLFSGTGGCDLALEAGGGVRSDIVAGPVKYTNIYETFPWADDTIYVVNMTGQQIYSYFKKHNCDAAMSAGWHVTANDGVPTVITLNGGPINLAQTFKVAINNYMYLHDTIGFDTIDPNPQTSTYLARTALVDFMAQAHATPATAYSGGAARYTLNTEFSGGYRAVITMMNDADTRTTFEDGFIRLISALPETLAHRGTPQVPNDLVNADGTVNAANRLSENQWYRSYLGFKTGALKPGDIVEVWGKGAFFGGNPEFVEQEGVQSDGMEFRIVGHDESLAKPLAVANIVTALNDFHKNHYVKLVVKKTGTSTVVDQNGTSMTVMDVTAFANKTLPGVTNDILVLTGVPTSESYSMRFRCDSAVLGSSLGITALPPTSTITSAVDPIPAVVSGPSVTLSATANALPGNVYSLTPIADATVASGNPTLNTNSTTLFLASGTTSFANERSWLKYDLSSIPAGSTIASAQLQLYVWSAAATSMTVALSGSTNDTWTETGITWNTQPVFGTTLDTEVFDAGATNVLYSWDVTPFAVQEFAGDKTASFVAKPVTENTATALTFKADSREFGSNAPVLQITTQAAGGIATVAQVQFFFRYSADNLTWGSWTAVGSPDTSAPYTANFSYPNGQGYYEFYSIATDTNSNVEPAPFAAQAITHYTTTAPFTAVTVGNGTATYNGSGQQVSVTTAPGLPYTVTYNGSSTPPVNAGVYQVVVSVTQPGYNPGASYTLVIAKAPQTISFGSLAPKVVGDPTFNLTATATSGGSVVFSSSNLAVATVSGNTVTIVGAGTADITASQAGNTNYLAGTPVVQTLTVTGSIATPAMPVWGITTLAVALGGIGAASLGRRKRKVAAH